MSVYNNNWSTIHDFTPVPGENNYSLLSEVGVCFFLLFIYLLTKI